MNYFNKVLKRVYEKVVEDDFQQPISEREVYAIVNSTRSTHDSYLTDKQQSIKDMPFPALPEVQESTLELEFRMMGLQPPLEVLEYRVTQMEVKLMNVDDYMLAHYGEYLSTLGKSLSLSEGEKGIFQTRRKAGELRTILERLKRMQEKIKAIAKLYVHIKNLKSTLKLLQKVPNIKRMNLVQLKSIDLPQLAQTNQALAQSNKGVGLLCLTNLYKYIVKVNNQELVFIINKLKGCLQSYDQSVYIEIIRSYSLVHPTATLERLMLTLIEEKVRGICDSGDLYAIGQRVIGIIINLHKITKWHKLNEATPSEQNQMAPIHRRLSVDSNKSNNSQEEPTTIELTEIVLIEPQRIKTAFCNVLDSCLCDLALDTILIQQTQPRQFYESLYLFGKIAQLNLQFTGLPLAKLRQSLNHHLLQRQAILYRKLSREMMTSLEQQRGDWNRLPYNNNFRHKPINKLLFRFGKMQKMDDFKSMQNIVSALFCKNEQNITENEDIWELKTLKVPSSDRIDRSFDEWIPHKQYLAYHEGDAILCQSSLKMLTIFQQYIDLLMFSPSGQHLNPYISHLILLCEYYVYYLYNIFLSSAYKNLFHEENNPQAPIDKRYGKKRLHFLYPGLSGFVASFKQQLQQAQGEPNGIKFYGSFKREFKEATGEHNQLLRAKVIATQSLRFCLAYLQQIMTQFSQKKEDQLWTRLQKTQSALSELSCLLLTESSQKMVGLQIEIIKGLFQSIKWHEPYEQLRDYIFKIISIVKQSFDKLRSSNRGEIPTNLTQRIFVLIWRTLVTFTIKSFLDAKSNNRRENKINFQKFIDELYSNFENKQNRELSAIGTAYMNFKTIFAILLCEDWSRVRELLGVSLLRYDYIFPIMMNILENSEAMSHLSEREKQARRLQFRGDVQLALSNKL